MAKEKKVKTKKIKEKKVKSTTKSGGLHSVKVKVYGLVIAGVVVSVLTILLLLLSYVRDLVVDSTYGKMLNISSSYGKLIEKEEENLDRSRGELLTVDQVKTVMADADDIESLIFDEIDSGISGRTAQMVAEKMNVLGRNHQIICITHLPQIAAMADEHYLIHKSVENNATHTNICKLKYDESVQELARMLGGVEITDAVVKNAQEMKELAHIKK